MKVIIKKEKESTILEHISPGETIVIGDMIYIAKTHTRIDKDGNRYILVKEENNNE